MPGVALRHWFLWARLMRERVPHELLGGVMVPWYTPPRWGDTADGPDALAAELGLVTERDEDMAELIGRGMRRLHAQDVDCWQHVMRHFGLLDGRVFADAVKRGFALVESWIAYPE